MRDCSIRQPYAALILRGIKTVEYGTRPRKIVGERFYIYASKGGGSRGEWPGRSQEAIERALAWNSQSPERPSGHTVATFASAICAEAFMKAISPL